MEANLVSSHPQGADHRRLWRYAERWCRWRRAGFDSNATVKEAQTLARHASPELTMNVYGRTRSERLSQVVEDVAEELKLGLEYVPAVYQQAVGSELKNATPLITRELRSLQMVKAAGIEPQGSYFRTKHF
jgi:hypothetical protein